MRRSSAVLVAVFALLSSLTTTTLALAAPGQASPSLSTELNASTITAGTTDSDTATLSSDFVPGGSGGTVTFTVYSDNGCGTSVGGPDTVPIDEGTGIAVSDALTFDDVGTFYWVAAFSGDQNNMPAQSGCAAEQMVVKAAPTVSTSLTQPSITVGSTDTDTATLSSDFVPGGTGGQVTFTVYSDSGCGTSVGSPDTVSIDELTGAAHSDPLPFNSAGTFYWVATFSGDSKNAGPVSSACAAEQLIVGTATLTISTLLNATSITVGGTDFDTATLSGFVPGGGTGTVTYTVYSNTGCSSNPQPAGTKTVTASGGVPNSNTMPFNSVGNFSWQAVYSGDSNNSGATSACESMAVVKASPTMTTNSNPNSGTAGVSIPSLGDTATFHNTSSAAPTGSVTFTLYTDTTCTTPVAGVTGSGTVSTTAGASTASFTTSWTPSVAGTYSWLAHYPGDSNNNSFTTTCTDANEQIDVGMASPTMTTQASPTTATAGASGTVGDKATFSSTGAAAPTGSVTFTLYTDTTCSTSTGVSGSGPIVTSGGTSTAAFSASWTPNAAGTASWRAHYAGDVNNNGFTTGCTDAGEQVTVGMASPTLTTQANPSTAVTGTAITVGDTATFAGAVSPSGSVTFTLYSNSTCTLGVAGVTGSAAVTTSAGVSSATFHTSWTPSPPGVYYWIASYPGDSNNNSFTTACLAANESITVANAVAPTVTAISQSAGPEGGGAIVTLTGTNLIGTTEVDFGSLHVTATGFHGYPCGPPLSPPGCFGVIGSTLISVFTPQASAPGTVDVTVINPAGQATLHSAYTFVAPGAYTALTPFRICDTRLNGPHCKQGALGAKGVLTVPITGVTGPSGQSVPAGALAVVVNVTGINLGSSPTYLTAYPGPSLPTASNISIDAHAAQANLVVVQLNGSSGGILIYNSVGSAQVVVDVQGYFAPPAGSGQVPGMFHSIAPLRICDTRANTHTECATTANNPIQANTWRKIVLSGLPAGGGTGSIPTTGAAAAVFNLTGTQGTATTYLTVQPPDPTTDACPTGPPSASNLNPKAGGSLPNRVISKLGPNQDVCVYNAAGSIEIIIDVNGWFGNGSEAATTPPAALYYAVPPTRICDTRSGTGTRCSGHPLTANFAETVLVAGVDVVPARGASTNPVAVVANLTGVAGTASTYLALYPSDATHTSSDLNPTAHDVIANLAIVGLSTTAGKSPGDVNLYNSLGTINAILDVAGWFQ